jgi:hypothetical protein
MSDEAWSTLIIQLASLAGVALLVGVAWMMGFRQRERIKDIDSFRAMLRGAEFKHAVVDAEGRAAFAELASGEFAASRVMGDRLVARRFPRPALEKVSIFRAKGRHALGVRLSFADPGFPSLDLETDDLAPPAWLERLRREIG